MIGVTAGAVQTHIVSSICPTPHQGFSFSPEAVRGVCVREVRGDAAGYRFINTDTLPLSPRALFVFLFTLESEWSHEEIVPFVE